MASDQRARLVRMITGYRSTLLIGAAVRLGRLLVSDGGRHAGLQCEAGETERDGFKFLAMRQGDAKGQV
jgi:hypothetical protein